MMEIRAGFFEECEELLESLQDGLQAFQDNVAEDETIHDMFRAVHSIKGGASAFGLMPLVEISHLLESVFDQIRSGAHSMTQDRLLVCLSALDHLTDHVDACRSDAPPPSDEKSVEAALRGLVEGTRSDPVTEPRAPKSAERKIQQKTKRKTMRVDLDRIERLVNQVGELVIHQSMLGQSLLRHDMNNAPDIITNLEENQRLCRSLQDSVMQIRTQSMKSLFQRMARVVRETSTELEKPVRFEIQGEQTELDKTVIEQLADPLTHLIRNAIDHGLESAENRKAIGKPESGLVKLSARQQSGRILIEIKDDGGGIDRDQVQKLAKSNGLLDPATTLSDAESDNLLFLPGLSTSKTVSNVSGRGVGLDVVKQAIQSLGGRIKVKSNPGKGTKFVLSLPLTLAVMEGLVVRIADQTIVIPLTSIVDTVTLDSKAVETTPNGQSVLRLHGFCPLIDLASALGFRTADASNHNSIAVFCQTENDQRVAFAIDDILEQQQIVVKGMPNNLKRAPGIVGATILGDGQIAMIVEPLDVMGADNAHPGLGASQLRSIA